MWRILSAFLCLCIAYGFSVETMNFESLGIHGGKVANLSQHPYQAIVKFGHFPLNRRSCGGVIVGKQNVLTSAHCIKGVSRLTPVYVLTGNTKDSFIPRGIRVSNKYIHPNYTRKHSDYDIAVLELAKPLVFGPYVNATALPASNKTVVAEGTVCNVTGVHDRKLKVVSIPIISSKVCQDLYPFVNVTKSEICAGNVNNGDTACSRDVGNGLVCKGVLTGIVSYGSKYCDANKPAIFTNVASVLDFVNKHIKA